MVFIKDIREVAAIWTNKIKQKYSFYTEPEIEQCTSNLAKMSVYQAQESRAWHLSGVQ